MEVAAGVTQEEVHTGFFHPPSAVLAFIFIARRIQPSLSLVDREVEFCVPTNNYNRYALVGYYYLFCEEKSQIVTAPRFELMPQR